MALLGASRDVPGAPAAHSAVSLTAWNLITPEGGESPLPSATSVGSLPSALRGTHRGQGMSRVSSCAAS